MKTQVLTRSFYEDAYLAFFIEYYLDLGFDRIVVFKADKEELGEFSLDFLQSDKERERVVIKYVANEGNDIYKNPENFPYYIDTNYDWSLHVDVDEFLVINRQKYTRVHDYITDLHKIMGVSMNEIYNVKFRWLCINKLNDNWLLRDSSNIINNEFSYNNQSNTDNQHIIGSFQDYLLTNKLEIYSFVKGMYQTNKVIDDNDKMDAHIVKFNEPNLENRIVIDNKYTKVNKYKSILFGSNSTPENNYCNGFILHFNTRSYSNSLTKCLVTQLRDNKKIKDLSGFRVFINDMPLDLLNEIQSGIISNEKALELKQQYKYYLNSKGFFPSKISDFHNNYEYLITRDNYISQLLTLMTHNKELICKKPFINLLREREILSELCNKHNINYNKLCIIIQLFNGD